MRKIFYLMLSLLLTGTASMNAQVTIGKDSIPHGGALLDLQQPDAVTKMGFKFPVVSLSDANQYGLTAGNSATAAGMAVYNNNADIANGAGAGLYIWDGSKWKTAGSGSTTVPVSSLSISMPENVTFLTVSGTLQLSANVLPADATNKTVLWSVIEGAAHASVVPQSGLVTGLSAGNAKIQATAIDGSGKTATYDLKVFLEVTGTNGSYRVICYPNDIGCWMIDNSKEGTFAAQSYYDNPSYVNGYYYTENYAASACPNGFQLPSDTEWNKLKNYINGGNDNDNWLSSAAFAGYYQEFKSSIWEDWDVAGYWWSNSSSFYDTNTNNMNGPDNKDPFYYMSVRCIKSSTSPISVTSVSISATGNATSLAVSGTLQLSANVQPAYATNKTVLWSIIEGSSHASINPQTGLVTGTSAGSVKVQVAAQDGSGKTATYDLMVSLESGVVPGTNGTYRVVCYPNNIGCWMVDNSKEGNFSAQSYNNDPDFINGYYYEEGQAETGCPAGFHLPSEAEWNKLKDYINGGNDNGNWLNSSAFAGYYYNHKGDGWLYWDDSGYWWSSGSSSYSTNTFNMNGPDYTMGSSDYLSVRCLKTPVSSISIAAPGNLASLNVSKILPLAAKVFPANASNTAVSWSIIEGSLYASINPQTGVVTGLSAGNVRVQAMTQDGSGKTATYDLTVTQGSVVVTGTNGTYHVACYPDGVGCWMVDNSKEGDAINHSYSDDFSLVNGYYYTEDQAANACPNGFHLPSDTEWNKLKDYINDGNDDDNWRSESAFAGFHAKYWSDWSNGGYWWSSSNTSYYYTNASIMDSQANGSGFSMSIRCLGHYSFPQE